MQLLPVKGRDLLCWVEGGFLLEVLRLGGGGSVVGVGGEVHGVGFGGNGC